MIARDLSDDRTILIRQEDHADLSAQFAAHWGNQTFARSEAHASLVAGAAHHDDHFRDVEWLLPIDLQAGRPFGHRSAPFSALHLEALERNVEWLDARDRYAALLVSMHHTGLSQGRYGVIKSWQNNQGKSSSRREMRPEHAAVVRKLEAEQEVRKEQLGLHRDAAARDLGYNYHLLQAFDLMSLYLCCDGYDRDRLDEATLEPVPFDASYSETTSLRLLPVGHGIVQITPYPFDVKELSVSVIGRETARRPSQPLDSYKDAYWRAERRCLQWTFVA